MCLGRCRSRSPPTPQTYYGTAPGETFFAASDIGWVVGHSYIVYAPLLHGCTSVMFEGKPVGTPDAAEYWRIVERYGVANMFTAPTALRAIRKADPRGELAAQVRAALNTSPVRMVQYAVTRNVARSLSSLSLPH